MGLITETNAQYYAGQQAFQTGGGLAQQFTCTFNVELKDSPIKNYTVKNNGVEISPSNYSVSQNVITISSSINQGSILVELIKSTIEDNLGSYEYISISDIL